MHIPFSGAGPATAAMLGGNIEMMFDNIPPQVGNIKAGTVRALAVTSLKRNSALPDVPTLDEIGLKGYEVVSFFGLAARAGTPRETVMRLNTALNNATRTPKLREILESRGADVVQGTPEDFTQLRQGRDREVRAGDQAHRRAGGIAQAGAGSVLSKSISTLALFGSKKNSCQVPYSGRRRSSYVTLLLLQFRHRRRRGPCR